MARPKSTDDKGEKKGTSFQIYTATKRQINYIAAVDETLNLTDIVEQALQEFIARWEKKNGPIPVK